MKPSISLAYFIAALWAGMAFAQSPANDKTSCPRTGKVSDTTKKKIEQNYLMNDVSMALWAKASSLHKLGDIESAKETYSQCIYMTCGRAWDPKGWYWSPAQDCAKKVRKLLK